MNNPNQTYPLTPMYTLLYTLHAKSTLVSKLFTSKFPKSLSVNQNGSHPSLVRSQGLAPVPLRGTTACLSRQSRPGLLPRQMP